ncbi:MAG: 4Fe-4S dicluster domain-containing protein [bacterium]
MNNQEKNQTETIPMERLDPNFKYEVASQPGGENITHCFSCGVCTAGCPITEIDDEYNPRKIIRMVLLGMKEKVLSSDTIWLCSLCYRCYARCPQNVKFTDIMSVLRDMAIKEDYVSHSFLEHMEEIDRISQKVRRGMVKAVIGRKREKFEEDKKGLASRVVGEV